MRNNLSTESPFSWPEQTDHRSERRPDSHRTIERMSVYHDNTQIPDTVPCMISRFFSIASRPQGLNAELHTGTYILCWWTTLLSLHFQHAHSNMFRIITNPMCLLHTVCLSVSDMANTLLSRPHRLVYWFALHRFSWPARLHSLPSLCASLGVS